MSRSIDDINNLTHLVEQSRLGLLLFRMGGKQLFGINVFKVKEIIKCPSITRIPQSHPVVRGIASLRGQTIPIMDLASAVGRRSGASLDLVIVSEYNRRIQGFLVSAVERIVNLQWEQIKPPPTVIGNHGYLTAVTEVDGDMVEIIDVEQVMAEVLGMKTQVSEDVGKVITGDERGVTPHVLLVDDSSMARKQVLRVMEHLGIQCTIAKNGREAWDLLSELAFSVSSVTDIMQVVVSDIEMPEMDGYTLTRKTREDPRMAQLFVCLHTSLCGTFNQYLIGSVGADYWITKFDPDELAEVVLNFYNRQISPGSAPLEHV